MKCFVFTKALRLLEMIVILPAQAAALPNLDYQDPAPLNPPNIGVLLLRLVISLIVVIGLALVVIKFLQRRPFFTRPARWIRILDQVTVGPNRGLLLAEIAGKIYVLALTDHSITKLLEIDDPSFLTTLLEEEEAARNPPLPGSKTWYPFWERRTFQNILLTKKEHLSRDIFEHREGE